MTKTLTMTLAAILAAGSVAPALAQSDPYGDYNREVDRYNNRASDYQAQQDAYQRQQNAYYNQRADYERARARYEADRAAYDARWGYGAYERRYGAFRGYYVGDPDYRGYSNNSYYAPYANTPCERRRSNNSTAGTIIGALAGAAIGSNVAARNARTEGAVLGAVVGGVIGNQVGKSTARCDANGYYYSYDQTYPYRESGYYRGYRSGRYDYNYYNRNRCRLAVAPVDYGNSTDYRYVRVCPDGRGRYRITQ